MYPQNIDFLQQSLGYSIREIPEGVKFWMVRTKMGYFYDEFVRNGFVALGWNIIKKDTDLRESALDGVKEQIWAIYGDERQMGPINKCKRFMNEIKVGDYFIIPNNGSSKLAIAIAGEYYEKDIDYEIERESIRKIENHECEITEIECPYRKRRKINVIKIVETNLASYDLRKAVSTYHGLSGFDNYAEDILNCIYDCYAYLGNVIITVNITKTDPIRPREISKLMYALTEYFCGIVEEDILSTTMNLNSPGQVRMKLKDGFNSLTKAKMPLVFAFIAMTGGSAFGFELPGISGAIKDWKTMNIEIEKEQVELERTKLAADKEKIENVKLYIDLMENAEAEGVDTEYMAEQLDLFYNLDGTLHFEAHVINEIEVKNEMINPKESDRNE